MASVKRSEHILKVVEEEGCEISHRVSKAMRFGLTEVQPEQLLTNAERVQEEAYDLIGAYCFAVEEGLLPPLDLSPGSVRLVTARKKAKIEKFMEISRAQGTLDD